MRDLSDRAGVNAAIDDREAYGLERTVGPDLVSATCGLSLTFPAAPASSEFTGERYLSEIPGPIQYEHYHRYVFALPYCAGKDVLDIASGEGYGSAFLASVARSVVGVDIAKEAVEAARLAYASRNLRYLAGSCTAIPVPDASIDVIVSFETLEHFQEQELFFAECKRVLRPGGVLIISTPDKTVYSPLGRPPNPFHARELTRAEFEAALASHFGDYDLVGQAQIVGSMIGPIGAKAGNFSCLKETVPRTYAVEGAVERPMYLIAVVGAKATQDLQLLNSASRAVALFAEAGQKASFLENEVVRVQREIALREGEIHRLGGVENELLRALQACNDRGGHLQRDVARLNIELQQTLGQLELTEVRLEEQRVRLEQQAVQLDQRRALTSRLESQNNRLTTALEAAQKAERRLAEIEAANNRRFTRNLGRRAERIVRHACRRPIRALAGMYRGVRTRSATGQNDASSADGRRPSRGVQQPAKIRPDQPPIELDAAVAATGEAGLNLGVAVILGGDRWLLPQTLEALRPAAQRGAEIIICSPYASVVTGAVSVPCPPASDPVVHLDRILRAMTVPAVVVITDNLVVQPDGFENVLDVFAQNDALAAVNGLVQDEASGKDGVAGKTVRPVVSLQPGLLCFDLDVYALVGGLRSVDGDIRQSLEDYSNRCVAAGFTVGVNPFIAAWPAEQDIPLQSYPPAKRARARALICDLVTPTPDQDCGSLNLVWNIRILQSLGYECTFLPTVNRKHAGRYTDELRKMGVHCVTADEYDDFWPFIVHHGSEFELIMLFRVLCASHLIDGVREFAPQARVIFSTVDLHFLREKRAAALANSTEMMANAEATQREELRVIGEADATIIVSMYELDLLAELAPTARSYWIPIVNPIAGLQSPAAGRAGVIFVGGFSHHPNVDAMLNFITEIWPKVRALAPSAELYVIGSSTPQELLALSTLTNGVKIVGFVRNLGPWYRSMRVNIAPLRYGGGVKGKVISSLSVGLPTVATPMAVEGMGLTHGLDVMVAETDDQFARAIADLCVDDDRWNNMARHSVEVARRIYSVEAIAGQLKALLTDLDLPH